MRTGLVAVLLVRGAASGAETGVAQYAVQSRAEPFQGVSEDVACGSSGRLRHGGARNAALVVGDPGRAPGDTPGRHDADCGGGRGLMPRQISCNLSGKVTAPPVLLFDNGHRYNMTIETDTRGFFSIPDDEPAPYGFYILWSNKS